MKQSKRVTNYRKTNKTSASSRRGHALTPKQRKRVTGKSKSGMLKGVKW